MTSYLTKPGNLPGTPISLDSLDLDNLEQILAESQDAPESLAMREMGAEEYDASWKAHRATTINSERIVWSWPKTKKEVEELTESGIEIHEEVTRAVEHTFVGLRGIVIGPKYSFQMKDSEGKVLCGTTCLVDKSYDPPLETKDRYCLEVPINQIHKSKKEPHELTGWLADRPYLELYGSRPPVGTDPDVKTSERRSCRSCVEAGEHYDGTLEQFLDPKSAIPTCRLDGYVLFAVFQLGILDNSEALKGGNSKVKWVDVADAQLMKEVKEGQLEPMTEPFILKIRGMSKVQHWPIGNNDFERPVVRTGKSCYLPPEIYSWGDYYSKYLHAKRTAPGDVRRANLGGNTVYPVVTDVYVGKLARKEFNAEYMPVFSPVRDPEVISAGRGAAPLDWLKAALGAYQYEVSQTKGVSRPAPALASSNGNGNGNGNGKRPTESNDKSAEEPSIEVEVVPNTAVVEETPETVAEQTSPPASNFAKRKFAAFSGPDE